MNSGPELSLQFDPTIPGRALLNGDEFTIDGQVYRISTAAVPPVVPGVRIVSYNANMTTSSLLSRFAIRSHQRSKLVLMATELTLAVQPQVRLEPCLLET